MTQMTEKFETVAAPATVLATGLPRVDLLPPEIHAARRLRNLQGGLVAGVAATVLVVGALWFVADAQVQRDQEALDAAQTRQVQVSAQVSRLAEVNAVYAAVTARKELLGAAMGGEVRWSNYLNDLALRVPDDVWLTNLTIAPGTAGTAGATGTTAGVAKITFTGAARTHNDVAVWLESLARQRGYVDAYFTSSAEAEIDGTKIVNFTSSVTVTSEALSNRYVQKPGN
jgi:Tfp pilus assembly protein PilN